MAVYIDTALGLPCTDKTLNTKTRGPSPRALCTPTALANESRERSKSPSTPCPQTEPFSGETKQGYPSSRNPRTLIRFSPTLCLGAQHSSKTRVRPIQASPELESSARKAHQELQGVDLRTANAVPATRTGSSGRGFFRISGIQKRHWIQKRHCKPPGICCVGVAIYNTVGAHPAAVEKLREQHIEPRAATCAKTTKNQNCSTSETGNRPQQANDSWETLPELLCLRKLLLQQLLLWHVGLSPRNKEGAATRKGAATHAASFRARHGPGFQGPIHASSCQEQVNLCPTFWQLLEGMMTADSAGAHEGFANSCAH